MKKIIKIIVSATLIGFLLYKVDWENIYKTIRVSDIKIIAITFFILVGQFPISALKWKKSLEIHDLNFSFLFLQKILCIGFFFNNFLPTSIGGDGYRVLKTMPGEGTKSRGVSAVLLERILGLAALLFLGFLGAILLFNEFNAPAIRFYIIGWVIIFGFIALVQYLRSRDAFGSIFSRLDSIKPMDAIFHNIQYIKNGGARLFDVIKISFVFQLLAITSIYLLFNAVGAKTGYAACAFIAAFTGIASILPVSINGIGVVEGSFVFSAMQVGMGYEQSLIVAFILRILTIPLSLICGMIYFYESSRS